MDPTAVTPLPKPRVRLRGSEFEVDFGCGRARLGQCADDPTDWWYETDDQTPRKTWGAKEALAQAWAACLTPPPPIGIPREELAAMIHEAEYDARECAKLMKRLLKLRTGLSWSVTGGRGTARAWLKIDSPKRRLVDNYYMPPADRALLGSILGKVPHCQGESIRTGRGTRSWYLWKIAGFEAPADLVVHPTYSD